MLLDFIARWSTTDQTWSSIPVQPDTTQNGPCFSQNSCFVSSMAIKNDSQSSIICAVSSYLHRSIAVHCYTAVLRDNPGSNDSWVSGTWQSPLSIPSGLQILPGSLQITNTSTLYALAAPQEFNYLTLPTSFSLLRWNISSLNSDPQIVSIWNKTCNSSSQVSGHHPSQWLQEAFLPTITAHESGVLIGVPGLQSANGNTCGSLSTVFFYQQDSTQLTASLFNLQNSLSVHSINGISISSLSIHPFRIYSSGNWLFGQDSASLWYFEFKNPKNGWKQASLPSAVTQVLSWSWSFRQQKLFVAVVANVSTGSVSTSQPFVYSWQPSKSSCDEVFDVKSLVQRSGMVNAIVPVSWSYQNSVTNAFIIGGKFSSVGLQSSAVALSPKSNSAIWSHGKWTSLGMRDDVFFSSISADLNSTSNQIILYAIAPLQGKVYRDFDSFPVFIASLSLNQSSVDWSKLVWKVPADVPLFHSFSSQLSTFSSTSATQILVDSSRQRVFFAGKFQLQLKDGSSATSIVVYNSANSSWSSIPHFPQVQGINTIQLDATGQYLTVAGHIPDFGNLFLWDLKSNSIKSNSSLASSSTVNCIAIKDSSTNLIGGSNLVCCFCPPFYPFRSDHFCNV